MSDNLFVMVQDVYQAVDSDQDPLTVDDIMHRAGPVRPLTVEEPPTPRNWVVPVTVTALAAALVLIIVGLMPILMNTTVDVEPAATTVPTDLAPPTTAIATEKFISNSSLSLPRALLLAMTSEKSRGLF